MRVHVCSLLVFTLALRALALDLDYAACARDLRRVSYETGASRRSESDLEIVRRYKNQDPGDPRSVDLTGFPGSQGLWRGIERLLWRLPPSEYDNRVLSLRRGDTVRFGDKTFRLGEFLGAGNATHIFALAERPKEVIRIPFQTQELATKGFHVDSWRLTYEKKEPFGSKHRVRITERGQGYTLTTRVNGTQHGKAFLDEVYRLLEGELPSEEWRPTGAWYLQADRQLVARDRWDMAWKLRALDDRVPLRRGANAHSTNPKALARQYLWDIDLKEWILVDWE